MSVLSPGQVRERQALVRNGAQLDEERQIMALAVQQAEAKCRTAWQTLAVEQERFAAQLAEAQRGEGLVRQELLLLRREFDARVTRAVAQEQAQLVRDLGERDRELRTLRKQLEAARGALGGYARQDERASLDFSVARDTLRQMDEAIPQAESFDAPGRELLPPTALLAGKDTRGYMGRNKHGRATKGMHLRAHKGS